MRLFGNRGRITRLPVDAMVEQIFSPWAVPGNDNIWASNFSTTVIVQLCGFRLVMSHKGR